MATKAPGKSVIEKISEYFNPFKKDEPKKTPIGGFGRRFKNMAKNNYKGLIGVLVPLCILGPRVERFNPTLKLEIMWLTMVWFYLWQPVSVPITSLIPVFVIPMCGIRASAANVKAFNNENIMLFVLSGWLIVLLNNSGVDKRLALWFLCRGDSTQYSGKKMVFKCSIAAFFLSMFSSRLIATYTLTQVMSNAYGKLAETGKKGPDFNAMRDIVNNAIQTSSGIGGTAIMHSSTVNILFRGCFQELAPVGQQYADVFNYLQYSAFMFPVAFAMFIINLVYHMLLVDSASKGMSVDETTELKKLLGRDKATIPPHVSLHETYSIIFSSLFLVCVFFRSNMWMSGWAQYTQDAEQPTILACKDASVAAIFVLLLSALPKGFDFLKIWGVKKKSELPPLKPESAILWWRFVDKNVNYGYMFTFGSAFAILNAATAIGLDHNISLYIGTNITDLPWKVGLLICVVVAAILCNVMTAMASCSMWLPFVLLMSVDAAHPWPSQVYLAALGVGVASNFGFCIPFQYTPAYYCHNTGKVPMMSMVKYSIPTVIICTITLYLAVMIYAPFLWDPDGVGFEPVKPGKP